MKPLIRSVKGVHDVLPDQAAVFAKIERQCIDCFARSGYEEIRLPVLEHMDLFVRSIGGASDIVQKEMFNFEDKRGDILALRPEGTASCARAVIEHSLTATSCRLWYRGVFFRRERPQKGRQRQFHQFGVEVFGIPDVAIEAEVIALTALLWKRLGLNGLKLKINTLGDEKTRRLYCEELVAWLRPRSNHLDADSLRRLDSNPLRILDSKDPGTLELLRQAPTISGFMDAESRRQFEQLRGMLTDAGLVFESDPLLVRGLDYYSGMVFEWSGAGDGAQSAVCAGGRYDGLVERLGGRPTPAVGCAFGIERISQLPDIMEPPENFADIYFIAAGTSAMAESHRLAFRLREQLPDLHIVVDCLGRSFKSQMRRADKANARLAVILGENEIKRNVVAVRDMRKSNEQVNVPYEKLSSYVAEAVVS